MRKSACELGDSVHYPHMLGAKPRLRPAYASIEEVERTSRDGRKSHRLPDDGATA
jgi:hypothetical protein